jgi:hypothetical protein
MSIQGGCLCGAVRYQCPVDAVLQFNCHCRDCQRSSGSAFAAIAGFPLASVSLTGVVQYFRSSGSSGKSIRRGFCPHCGSSLFGLVDLLPGLLCIRAGTFDDPGLFAPKANLFVSHAPAWSRLDPCLRAYAENMLRENPS